MRNDTKDTTPARQPLPLRRLLPPLSTDNGNDDNNDKKNHKNRADVVRVYLIRHGQTDWNLEGRIQGGGFDIPLNETGKLQARLAAKALEGIPMDVVASSPLSRARETADILMETMLLSGSNSNSKSRRNSNNHNHLIRRIVDSGFTEMKFGALEGLRYKAITEKEDYDRFLAIKQRVVDDPDYRFPASSRVDPWEKKREHEPELEHETKTDDDDDDDERTTTRPVTVVVGSSNDNCEGESTRIVQERSLEALSRALDRTSNNDDDSNNNNNSGNDNGRVRHVAIVAHARTNKVLIAAMLYGEAHGRFPQIQQGNVNISVLDFYEDSDSFCNDDNDNDSNSNDSGKSKSSTNTKDTRGCWKSRILNYTEHVDDVT